jgi:hypothetical protein
MTTTGFTDSTGTFRKTRTAKYRLPLTGRLAAGTALAAFADGASPTPGLALDGSEASGIRWNNHATPAAIFESVPLPDDRQPNTPLYFKVLAHKTGATVGDAVTFTIGAFFQQAGALYDADSNAGGASSAMTGNAATKTSQLCSLTIAASDVPEQTATTPANLTYSVKPTDGTLGTDDVTVTAMWIEYTQIQNPD